MVRNPTLFGPSPDLLIAALCDLLVVICVVGVGRPGDLPHRAVDG